MRPLIFLVACLLSGPLLGSATENESDLLTVLSSPDVTVRAEAVRNLHPQRIGDLEPELAIRAVLLATQDSESQIRRAALGGLGLLSAAVAAGNTNPETVALAQAIHTSRELRPMLEKIVAEDPSIDVAVTASLPFMALYGSDPAAEAILLDRADKAPSAVDRVTLMSNLEGGGIDGEGTRDRLEQYLSDAPTIVQLAAAQLLLTGETLPADRFEDYLRIIETSEAFADPKVVRALPRFGVSTEKYLPRLITLRSRLEEEVQKPREQRTLVIYNDAYYKRTLDEAIAKARTSIEGGRP